jgi:Flp pilus assembly protein CpaB
MWDKMASCAIAQKAARDPVPASTYGRTAVIELPNEQAAALKAKAAAEGLSLEAWLKQARRRTGKPTQPAAPSYCRRDCRKHARHPA